MIQYDYINATFINDITETVQYRCWNDQLMSFIIIIRYNSFAYLFLNILIISYLSALGSKLEINVLFCSVTNSLHWSSKTEIENVHTSFFPLLPFTTVGLYKVSSVYMKIYTLNFAQGNEFIRPN